MHEMLVLCGLEVGLLGPRVDNVGRGLCTDLGPETTLIP